MGFRVLFAWVVTDAANNIVGVFKKFENAVRSLPQSFQVRRCQINDNKWYFAGYTIEQFGINDSNDL